MTDNEIIKSLECCAAPFSTKCKVCPLFNKDLCQDILLEKALDFIKRQKAEIERLTINMNAFGLGMIREKEKADTIRSEAIKEFAERLKEQPIKCGLPLLGLQTKDEVEEYFNDIMRQVGEAIDNLVKEMVGD